MDDELLFQRTLVFITRLHMMEDTVISESLGDELTELQHSLLLILYLSGPKNLSALSRCLHMNMPNCSREVKKLTQKGYIHKEVSRQDKRIIDLSLCAEGRSLMESSLHKMKAAFFGNTGEWDSQRIQRVLSSLNILETEFQLSDNQTEK